MNVGLISRCAAIEPFRSPTWAADPAWMLLSLVGAVGRDLDGHSHRVARHAHALATDLGLSRREIGVVVWSGLLHDLGKVLLPAELIAKPATLTDADQKLIRRHPLLGAELLAINGLPTSWIAAVAAHHERWDGAGYPTKLAGSRIPLAARILAIADTYDAMTSHRSYRPALSHRTAARELERVGGYQLDPELTEIFLAGASTFRR